MGWDWPSPTRCILEGETTFQRAFATGRSSNKGPCTEEECTLASPQKTGREEEELSDEKYQDKDQKER